MSNQNKIYPFGRLVGVMVMVPSAGPYAVFERSNDGDWSVIKVARMFGDS